LTKFIVDLHIHSNVSPCSNLDMRDIIECSYSCGINGIALTDHNSIEGYERIRKIGDELDVAVFLGYELQVKEGELLIYGIDKVLPINLPAFLVIKIIRNLGGVVIAAHPFRRFLTSLEEKIYNLDLHGIEVSDRLNYSLNSRAITAAKKMDVAMLAGSDAHNINEIGWCATEFQKKINSTEELVKEIEEKRCKPILL
jgi:predicted metal-dependent phosphoesterase TrpH